MSGSSAQGGYHSIVTNRQQTGNGTLWKFFEWIDKSSFEVAADAFTTFRVRLPRPWVAFVRGEEPGWLTQARRNS